MNDDNVDDDEHCHIEISNQFFGMATYILHQLLKTPAKTAITMMMSMRFFTL